MRDAEQWASRLAVELPGPAAAWLREAVAALAASPDEGRFASCFAAATRRLGAAPCAALPPFARDELGRAALLLAALSGLPDDLHAAFVRRAFQGGDSREQRAVLRALPLLPVPERFVELAIHACRTNVVPLFEGIACESPYAAAHFPEASFNQLVMKAIFLGLPLARIEGLALRWNGELARMAGDLARERRAAGRAVPEDLVRLVSGGGGAR